MHGSRDVTALLERMRAGDAIAAETLANALYGELRGIAAACMQRQGGAPTLQPTALVHEAWIRLARTTSTEWQSRVHFLSVAARAMRSVLVDHVRARKSVKRGGAQQLVRLDDAVGLFESNATPLDELDDALERLGAVDEQLVRIVELRFFGGLTLEETAAALGVTRRTVDRGWATARAWLRTQVTP